MTFPTPEIEHADTAYESMRAINHLTITTHAIPAPEMYAILGNLKCLGYALDQALRQLCSALQLSLDTFDVYETDGADPVTRAGWAIGDMTAAAEYAAHLGRCLDSAQSEVARQAYNERPVLS